MVDFPKVVDLDDVGMFEGDAELRFLDEHADELVVVAEGGKDALDDEPLLEALDAPRGSEEDFRHAPAADAVVEDVVPILGRFEARHDDPAPGRRPSARGFHRMSGPVTETPHRVRSNTGRLARRRRPLPRDGADASISGRTVWSCVE